MEELQRIRYVTQHFEELQGYRLLPFAAFYLVGAVYDATLPHGCYHPSKRAPSIYGSSARLV